MKKIMWLLLVGTSTVNAVPLLLSDVTMSVQSARALFPAIAGTLVLLKGMHEQASLYDESAQAKARVNRLSLDEEIIMAMQREWCKIHGVQESATMQQRRNARCVPDLSIAGDAEQHTYLLKMYNNQLLVPADLQDIDSKNSFEVQGGLEILLSIIGQDKQTYNARIDRLKLRSYWCAGVTTLCDCLCGWFAWRLK